MNGYYGSNYSENSEVYDVEFLTMYSLENEGIVA